MRIFWASCCLILTLLSSVISLPVSANETQAKEEPEIHAELLSGDKYSLAESAAR